MDRERILEWEDQVGRGREREKRERIQSETAKIKGHLRGSMET